MKKWIKEITVSTRLKEVDSERLKEIADKKEMSVSNLVRELIKQYLDEQ